MKQISLILLFLGIFLLPTTSIAELTGDACSPSDTNASFSTSTTTEYTGDLNASKSTTFYFTIQAAGTLTLTPDSPGDKIDMAVSTDSCPTTASSIASQSITVTESTDINVLLYANLARTYTLTAVFVPAPLTISKTASPSQVAEDTNTDVTFTFTITNNTDSDMSDMTFTDVLPAGVTLLGSITNPTGWTCSGTSTITCTAATLLARESVEFDINTTVNIDSDIDNTATVDSTDTGIDEVSSTTIVRAVSGTQEVDLEILKFAQGDTIPPDTDFTYVIFVVNHDQNDAELVTVTDSFPLDQNVSLISYDRGSGWDCDIDDVVNETNSTFTCLFDRSMGHEITYFTLLAHTDAGDYNATATNTATVTTLNPNSDDHNTTDTAVIEITDVNVSLGGTIGYYPIGGSIEVSDTTLSSVIHRDTARIHTKVASTTGTTLPTYFVDYITGYQTAFESNVTTAAKTIPVTVLFKLADDNCNWSSETHLSYDGSSVAAVFESGDDYAEAGVNPQNGNYTYDLRNIATKKARLIMKYIDINAILDTSGETCNVSSLSGNIKGLPQCLTNAAGSNNFDNNKYINVFGIEAFVRCTIQNGQPCDSSNGGYGDDPYDSEYGCYECTLGSVGYCSNDNFAIRPKAFDANITDGDVFRAGQDYSIDFKGLTEIADEATLDYNETQIPPGILLSGTTPEDDETFSVDANVSNSANCAVKYLTIDPLVDFQDGLDSGPFTFDDIGDINFSIHETAGYEFAIVDENDTSWDDRHIEDFNRTIRVIPHHFEINATLTDYNDPQSFTYMHDINQYDHEDNHSMASTLTIKLKAVREDNVTTTKNYTETCYANDTNLTLNVNDFNITYPGSTQALNLFHYYNPVEDSEKNNTLPAAVGNTITVTTLNMGITGTNASFPVDAVPDGNGTTEIEYKLNFDRQIHLAVNPFRIVLNDVNITEMNVTELMDPTILVTDPDGLVQGDTGILTDQNVTYYYARTRASKFFYEDINNSTVTTPILIDIYCDLGFSECSALIDTASAQINEADWWLSLGHRTTNNDGNITLMEGSVVEGASADWSVSPNVTITATPGAMDNSIIVSRGSAPTLPLTVEIDLDTTNVTDTNRWLIYNAVTDAILQEYPSPLYKVRFIGVAGWAGHGDTGHVVGSNESIKKHRRLEW